jgi:type I restriction enzyme S subunit
MSSKWRECLLADVISVKHGFAFKGEYFTDEKTPYQLTTPGNFSVGGGFQPGKGKYYCGPIPDDYVLRPGDVIVTMTDLSKAADTLGFAAFVPTTCGTTWLHNQRVGLVQIKQAAEVRPKYLQYLMRGNEYRHWIVSTATGSTVKHTSPGRICEFVCQLPSLREQDGIANVLGALDDRIALLRETNATLEAIAQALFKSWFVDFDPVRAKQEGRAPEGMDEATAALFPDSFEESELGLVPSGWRDGVLGDVAEYAKAKIQPDAMSSATSYVGLEHVPRRSLGLDAWGTGENLESAKSCFVKDDILFGKLRPYFHKVVIAPFPGVCSTDILVCNAKLREYYTFVALHLFSDRLVSYADRLSNGAKMPRVGWNDLAAYQIIVPSMEIASILDMTIRPLFEKIIANVMAARTLAELRDTLLPRLISGQLRLPDGAEMVDQLKTGT